MEITTRPAIIVSERDLERLEAMLAGLPDTHPGAEALREELDRAQILPSEQMPGDVVTMNSRIRFVVDPAGKEVEVDLVYPRDLTGLPDQLIVESGGHSDGLWEHGGFSGPGDAMEGLVPPVVGRNGQPVHGLALITQQRNFFRVGKLLQQVVDPGDHWLGRITIYGSLLRDSRNGA